MKEHLLQDPNKNLLKSAALFEVIYIRIRK